MYGYMLKTRLRSQTPSPSKRVRSKEDKLEEGEILSKSPLSKIHESKVRDLDGRKITDSLERPSKAPARRLVRVDDDVESHQTDSSLGVESSFVSMLSHSKQSSYISLKSAGVLENQVFLKKLHVPDRRDIIRRFLISYFTRVLFLIKGFIFVFCFKPISNQLYQAQILVREIR